MYDPNGPNRITGFGHILSCKPTYNFRVGRSRKPGVFAAGFAKESPEEQRAQSGQTGRQ